MSTEDKRFYDEYDGRSENCWMCNAYDGTRKSACNESGRYLCKRHFELYQDEVMKIRLREMQFPSGFDEVLNDTELSGIISPSTISEAKEKFLTDAEIWTKKCVLEIMVENKRISYRIAAEQLYAMIRDQCRTIALKPKMQQIVMDNARRREGLPQIRL